MKGLKMDDHGAGAMVTLATRQAEALEAIAQKLERLINIVSKKK
jgi:hypothetical protein